MNIFFILLSFLPLFSGFKDKIKEKNVKLVTNEYDFINLQHNPRNWEKLFLLNCFSDEHLKKMHSTYSSLAKQMLYIGFTREVEEPPYLELQNVSYLDRADLILRVKECFSDEQAELLARAFEMNSLSSVKWFNILQEFVKINTSLSSVQSSQSTQSALLSTDKGKL